jgi:hypothetical protein
MTQNVFASAMFTFVQINSINLVSIWTSGRDCALIYTQNFHK